MRAGESRMTSFPTGIHPCADGHMALMLLEKSQWQGFVKAMGSPEWAANPMFDIPMWNLREYSQEIRLLAEPWFEGAHQEGSVRGAPGEQGALRPGE